MSFILESIKQAERERKLGQQAPSISIEYTGEHIEDVDNPRMRWLWLGLLLFIGAILVWGASYYFTNQDRQYIEKLTLNNIAPDDMKLGVMNNETENKIRYENDNDKSISTIAMVPVKKLHKSDLKSVKLISEEDKQYNEQKQTQKYLTQPEVQAVAAVIQQKQKPVEEKEPREVTKIVNADSGKQQLAAIYSDLAELSKQAANLEKLDLVEQGFADDILEIESASYVAADANTRSSEVTAQLEGASATNKRPFLEAVDTGVPSFGELPYDVQEKLPEFNVSVHMFHDDPLQRKIRINGHMYTEGKNLQQDLALVEITPYGAVFDYQGHLFRVNVR
jgi:hypothetical protein